MMITRVRPTSHIRYNSLSFRDLKLLKKKKKSISTRCKNRDLHSPIIMPPQTFAKKKVQYLPYTISSLNILLPKQKSDTVFTKRHRRPRSCRRHIRAMNYQTMLSVSEKATGAAVSLENLCLSLFPRRHFQREINQKNLNKN